MARSVIVAAPVGVTVVPFTVAGPASTASATGSPELAEAVTGNAVPTRSVAGSGAKEMAWVARAMTRVPVALPA